MVPRRTLTAAACLLACLPILAVRLPPLYDYPAHLAGMRILADLITQRHFAALYTLHWAIIPNLAADFIVVPLHLCGAGIETAGKLCLLAIMAGLGTGVVRLNRALTGEASLLPLLAFGLLFAEPVKFGFINYVAGIAMLLHALAFWVAAPARPAWRLALIGIAACILLFFCHLLACAVFIAGVLGLQAASLGQALLTRAPLAPSLRRAALVLPGAACAAALYACAPLAGSGAREPMLAALLKPKHLAAERLGMLLHAVDGYAAWPDWGGLVLVAAAALALARTRRAGFVWQMLPLLAALVTLCFMLPVRWAGLSYIADRLPFLIALLTLASIRLPLKPGRPDAAFAALILGVVALRCGCALSVWRADNAAYAPLLTALETLPDGAAIYTATFYEGTAKSELPQPWTHIAAWAPLHETVFDAGTFALPGQNIILTAPAMQARAALNPKPFRSSIETAVTPLNDPFRADILAAYDYVLAVHPEQYRLTLPPALVPLSASGPAVLYRIAR